MKYTPPIGSLDPEAPYVDGNPSAGIRGSAVPASALEHAQREIVHVIKEAGLEPDSADLKQLYQAIEFIIARYNPLIYPTAMFPSFDPPDSMPSNFRICEGGLVSNADVVMPVLYQVLQEKYAHRAVSQTAWTAEKTKGEAVSFFVLDTTAKTIRLPDMRKAHIEGASAELLLGNTIGDMIRNIYGNFSFGVHGSGQVISNGAFSQHAVNQAVVQPGNTPGILLNFSAKNVVPTGVANRPKSLGVNWYTYIG